MNCFTPTSSIWIEAAADAPWRRTASDHWRHARDWRAARLVPDTSNTQSPRARRHGPFVSDAIVPHDLHAIVQRDRRADVRGKSIQDGADGKLSGALGLEHKVLLIVADRTCVRQRRKNHARMRHFARD